MESLISRCLQQWRSVERDTKENLKTNQRVARELTH